MDFLIECRLLELLGWNESILHHEKVMNLGGQEQNVNGFDVSPPNLYVENLIFNAIVLRGGTSKW